MLSKNLVIISTIASIATLMGLLGTVIGMIRAFKALAQAGAPDAVDEDGPPRGVVAGREDLAELPLLAKAVARHRQVHRLEVWHGLLDPLVDAAHPRQGADDVVLGVGGEHVLADRVVPWVHRRSA